MIQHGHSAIGFGYVFADNTKQKWIAIGILVIDDDSTRVEGIAFASYDEVNLDVIYIRESRGGAIVF